MQKLATRLESKRDWWLLLVIGAAIVSVWHPFWSEWNTRDALGSGMLLTFNSLLTGFILWIVFGTYYLIDDSLLIIRSGPFHWRIEIAGIETVVDSRSLLSSPALSLKRLRIVYAKGQILVSPEDKESFVARLKALNGRIR